LAKMMWVVWLAGVSIHLPTRIRRPPLAPVQRVGRHVGEVPGRGLVECPTPGCRTPLRPSKVAAHLLKCPVLAEQRALNASGYYCRGINGGVSEVGYHAGATSPLTAEVAGRLESRCWTAHDAHMPGRLMHTPELGHFAVDSGAWGKQRKRRESHHIQRRAIAEQLAALGVLGRGHVLIELGAGNGALSLAIAEAYPEVSMDALVLLDQKSKPKGKGKGSRLSADPALESRFASVKRVKLGLEDTDLAGLRDELAPGRHIVVVAKHLCGSATDFALRALVSACAKPFPPLAAVVGTCCHHRCEWAAYPSRPFMRQALGVASHDEFAGLCRLSSRGVNGADMSERAHTARRAKDLLDYGRARFLRSHGFDVRLCTYVDASVTPENVLIVAQGGHEELR